MRSIIFGLSTFLSVASLGAISMDELHSKTLDCYWSDWQECRKIGFEENADLKRYHFLKGRMEAYQNVLLMIDNQDEY